MHSNVRQWVVVMIAVVSVVATAGDVVASRADGALRDTFYFSPSWGYSMRWYADEWSVAAESSKDRVDTLVLEHATGATVRFEGRAAFHGDTRACLDAEVAALEADGAQDIVVIRDDQDRPQKIFHPWRSWILLIAAMPVDGELADQAIYLDCRTLEPDEAVFIRELRMAAPDFATDLIYLDVLNAALPRGAWVPTYPAGLTDPALGSGWTEPPLPADPTSPFTSPTAPRLLSGIDGEVGMITDADRNLANQDFVLVIENTSASPLVIDPAQFVISNLPSGKQVDPNVAALSATWTDGTEEGLRSIQPGETASLYLRFPPVTETTGQMSLVFWDEALEVGGIAFTCITQCGYGGGGSRPKLRAIR